MDAIIWVILGLAGLAIGGEMLVRGAVSAARALGMSPMMIGLTLVGFGTSSPELFTSLQAALTGSPGIAIGNVVGSNIGNVLLILGIGACLAPLAVDAAAFRRDGTVLVAATGLCLGVVLLGDVSRPVGAAFACGLAAYLTYVVISERRATASAAARVYEAEADIVPETQSGAWAGLGLALVGLVVTVLGARTLVFGAVDLAQAAGLSETVIGLTIVAIGTSMPELVTTVIAVRKKQGDVALGNIIGSNIFNILGILGITAVVSPMVVPAQIIALDIWVMCVATGLLIVFARTGWVIARREGAVLLGLYVAYMVYMLGTTQPPA